jgi:HK97 gp10 family phage protein
MSSIRGIVAVTARLKKLSKRADLQVKSSVQRNTDQILDEALQNVPIDRGFLRDSGDKNTQNPYLGIVTFGGDLAPYAPYVEFGTGENAEIPEGFDEFAMKFYVNGQGRTKPHPYLIPAFIKYKKIFLQDMKKIAKNISK